MKFARNALGLLVSALLFSFLIAGCQPATTEQIIVVDDTSIDYTKLIINEINPFANYVEIFNAGDKEIPLEGVKLISNDGLPVLGGTWTGAAGVKIPAKAFRIILFAEEGVHGLAADEKALGTVQSSFSMEEYLKIALFDPDGSTLDVFIRGGGGDSQLLAWGEALDMGLVADDHEDDVYARFGETWAYAAATQGAANGEQSGAFEVSPGYRTTAPAPVAVPVIADQLHRLPTSVIYTDEVSIITDVSGTAPENLSVYLYYRVRASGKEEWSTVTKDDITDTGVVGRYTGKIPAQETGSVVDFWVYAHNDLSSEIDIVRGRSYTVDENRTDYTTLRITEISGTDKFVEIYNSGESAIALRDVVLDINNGAATWEGTNQSIGAGEYRLIAFDSYTIPLAMAQITLLPQVNYELSGGKILKVALLDPADESLDVFIRGKNPLAAFGSEIDTNVAGAVQAEYSYSRMEGEGDLWAYAEESAGKANTAKKAEIVSPGYLVFQPINPPVVGDVIRDREDVKDEDIVNIDVTVSTLTLAQVNQNAVGATYTGTNLTVFLKYRINGGEEKSIEMDGNAPSFYTRIVAAETTSGDLVEYWVHAVNTLTKEGGETITETTTANVQSYRVALTLADYKAIKLNEVSGVGEDNFGDDEDDPDAPVKFYELINTGGKDIPLEGFKIYYYAPETGDEGMGTDPNVLPYDEATGLYVPYVPNEGDLTWTGADQIIAKNNGLHLIQGRNPDPEDLVPPDTIRPNRFNKGLTGKRILRIVLVAPDGTEIDWVNRYSAAGAYAYEDESFSRFGDKFYFTPLSPNAPNPGQASDYAALPADPPIVTVKQNPTVVTVETPEVTITGSAKTGNGRALATPAELTWWINGVQQNTIPLSVTGGAFSHTFAKQNINTVIEYSISVKNSEGERGVIGPFSYETLDVQFKDDFEYLNEHLMLNEISGVGGDEEKFYELYNSGDYAIDLSGVTIHNYDVDPVGEALPALLPDPTKLQWEGQAGHVIMPHSYFSTVGRNASDWNGGQTAERKIIVYLRAPPAEGKTTGDLIDHFIRAEDTGEYAGKDKSFSRLPDGVKTSKFYFTEPTPTETKGPSAEGAPNVGDPASLLEVPQGSVTPPTTTAEPVRFLVNNMEQASGVYSSPFTLTLDAGGGAIYYTTDGTEPSYEKFMKPGQTNVFKYDPNVPIQVVDRNSAPNVLSTQFNLERMLPKTGDPIWGTLETGDVGFAQSPYFPNNTDVPKGTVIRAVSVASDNVLHSAVVTKTYFVGNYTGNTYGNHPIISLVVEPEDLLEEVDENGLPSRRGILVRGSGTEWLEPSLLLSNPTMFNAQAYNFQLKGDASDRAAHMDFFENRYLVPQVSGMVSMRVKGSYSRSSAQKSFNIYAGKAYGEHGDFNYALIPGAKDGDGGQMNIFRNFTLRNGGNDTESTKFLDAFTHDLLQDRNFTTQVSVPCIVFINGEYWGPYNLQEKYGDNHINYKYGINGDNYIAYDNDELDDGKEPGDSGYNEELNLFPNDRDEFINLDMSVQANYDRFLAKFDVDNMIDYFASEIYVGNEDWPNNNYRVWRTRDPEDNEYGYGDGKWRWQLFDMDAIFGINSDGSTKNSDELDAFERIFTMDEKANDDLFQSLLRNPEFARKFVNTITDIHNINFKDWSSRLSAYDSKWRPLMGNEDTDSEDGLAHGSGGYFGRWGFPYSAPEAGDNGFWTGVFSDYVGYVRTYLAAIGSDMFGAGGYLEKYFNGAHGLSGVNIADLGITKGMGNIALSVEAGAIVKISTVTSQKLVEVNGTARAAYYRGLPIDIELVQAPAGKVFSHWTFTGGTIASGTSPKTTVTLGDTGDGLLTPMFDNAP